MMKAVLIAACLLGAPAASGHVPEQGPGKAKAALQDLDALARKSRAAGRMPRLSEPTAAAVFARLFDAPALLGRPPYSADDIPALLDLGDIGRAVYKSYALFTPDSRTLPDTAANTGTFQDELARSTAFMVAEQAAAFDAFADFVAHLKPEDLTKARRDGLHQAQAGAVEFVAGADAMLSDPNLADPNRVVIADALAAHGPALARGLSLPDRGAMAASAGASMTKVSGPARKKLEAFVGAMADKDCAGLCAVE